MTNTRIDNWEGYSKPSYKQQKIKNPSSGQSPNNARFSPWHFSKLYNLRKYEAPQRWGTDGRGRYGIATLYPFLCNVQPINKTEREYELLQLREADRTKALIYVTYDPFITNEMMPNYVGVTPKEPVYADGMFIRLGDQRTKVGDALGNTGTPNDLGLNHAHSDVLEFDGELWQALWTDLHNGGDEDKFSYVGRIGHAIMGLWTDEAQERHSSITNRETFTGV